MVNKTVWEWQNLKSLWNSLIFLDEEHNRLFAGIIRLWPGCPRCQGWGRSRCRPCPRPSPPSPLESHLLIVSWCLGVNCPPQTWRLLIYPPSSLGNWSHPWPLVSEWSAVDCSHRAAAALSSLDQLSAAWCALILIQPTKIGQQLTVSFDFKSTAGCLLILKL